MNFEAELNNIIKKINALHPEDPKIYDYWGDLTRILTIDEKETIRFLNDLEDENAVNIISSVFDDVALQLKSPDLLRCLESLQVKFPNLLLEHMIDAARQASDA